MFGIFCCYCQSLHRRANKLIYYYFTLCWGCAVAWILHVRHVVCVIWLKLEFIAANACIEISIKACSASEMQKILNNGMKLNWKNCRVYQGFHRIYFRENSFSQQLAIVAYTQRFYGLASLKWTRCAMSWTEPGTSCMASSWLSFRWSKP